MYFQRIRELREAACKKQEDIACLLNMSRVVYGRYERGVRAIPVWAVVKLARYYRISSDYLLGLTDNPAGQP